MPKLFTTTATAVALSMSTVASATAAPEVWAPVSWGGDPGDRQIYFVSHAMAVPSAERLVIKALILREAATAGGVQQYVERTAINCGNASSITLDVRMFDRSGKLLHALKGDGKAEVYAPGSAWRTLVDTVCDGSVSSLRLTKPKRYAADFFARTR